MTLLESKLGQPVFENSYETNEQEIIFQYVGTIRDFNFIKDSLYAKVELQKFQRITVEPRKRHFWSSKKESVETRKTLWHLQAGKGYYRGTFDEGEIFHQGTNIIQASQHEIQISEDYQTTLIGLAANQGIIVYKNLLDRVFKPIEIQVIQFYKQVFPEYRYKEK